MAGVRAGRGPEVEFYSEYNWVDFQFQPANCFSCPYNKKKTGKLKINDCSWTHQRTEITRQTPPPKSGEMGNTDGHSKTHWTHCQRKKMTRYLLKNSKADFILEVGVLQEWDSVVGERDWAHPQIQQEKEGIYSQGAK